MSYELGAYDPSQDLAGFSLKSIGKAVSKTVKAVAKPVAAVSHTVVGRTVGAVASHIPGAGIATSVAKAIKPKAKAVKAAAKEVKRAVDPMTNPNAPPTREPGWKFVNGRWQKAPPPKSKPKVIPITRAGSPKGSGVFSDVTSGSSTTAKKKVPVTKPVIKAQAEAAGLRFKKRAKKGGGTETVAVNQDGAVVSKAIPDSVVAKAGATVDPGVLPVDAPQANAPSIPSAQSVVANGGGNSEGSGVATNADATPTANDGGIMSNPLVLAAGAGVALLVLSRR